jgi:TonB family protein
MNGSRRLVWAALAVSLTLHAALLAVSLDAPQDSSPRDIGFLIERLAPAPEEAAAADAPAPPEPEEPIVEPASSAEPDASPAPPLVRYVLEVVRPRVHGALRLPAGARPEGVAVIRIEIDRTGRLCSSEFLERSPLEALDAAALAAVEAAAPFAPPDESIPDDPIWVNCRFDFARATSNAGR